MRRIFSTVLLAAMAVPTTAFVVGCDETVSEKTTVERKADGTEVKEQKKVTESPDGTITKTEEKKVDH